MVSHCKTRDEYEVLIRTWMDKLKTSQWIEGTPWNIPEDHKKAIIEHYLFSVSVKNEDGSRQ